MLIDSVFDAEAKARGHHWTLMGFETNNRLHPDNPPHWHLAYHPGAHFSANGNPPHLWLDDKGRNIENCPPSRRAPRTAASTSTRARAAPSTAPSAGSHGTT
ncbi:hypothetical protein [Streptomyces sp. NPDC001970]